MKILRQKPTKIDWIKVSVILVLYIIFLIWIRSWLGIIVIPFIFDAYITHRINWGWWKDLENPVTRTIMSWVDAIVFALVAVYFVNIYFFQNYTIPSSSLEKSLLVGDYLFVSKMSYGPRVPQTPLHMPLCQHTLPFGQIKSYISWPQWEYKRVSPKPVGLNDIVVFNYPSGDSVMMDPKFQAQDYYLEVYREGREIYLQNSGTPWPELDSMSALDRRHFYEKIYALGRNAIIANKPLCGEIGWRPVDRRENYVKRCVGLPGQTLEIKEGIVYLDGKRNPQPKNVQYNYNVELCDRVLGFPDDLMHELGISKEDVEGLRDPKRGMPMTQAVHDALLKHKELVKSITPVQDSTDTDLYPLNGNRHWTRDNYGPIWIPAKGKSISLNLDILPIYERPIRVYEGNDLKVTADGKILINGNPATSYTFKMDYYWMMGDNRHNSADSRYWGFVPEDHIVGKPIMIWLSLDPDRGLFNGGIRWKRMFRWVDNIAGLDK